MSTCLPIEAIKDELFSTLENHQALVLTAPPGAGKSTRLPLWFLQNPRFDQKIYLLQPRRVAAKNIALYLAQQLGEAVGNTVGYRLKNESKVSKQTRLEVITEGILTQIIQNDAELEGVGLIIFDEFHERSLHGDLALALARDIQQGLRDDLTLLVMSATLASEQILAALPDAKAIVSEGRSFPITISYQPPRVEKLWREKLISVVLQAASEQQGSMLVFLPGASDIHYVASQLEPKLASHIQVHKLFGQLSVKEQQQVIAPAPQGFYKIVLATNIAETSLTIDGVDLVIDSGLEKVANYDAGILTNRLVQRKISKASVIQRAGRAGRLKAGSCIRIYSEEDFSRRHEHTDSEIQRSDILAMLMEAARWGVKALAELPLIELPAIKKELAAWQELQQLALVNGNNQLTHLGNNAAKLPCHPRFARMLIQARELELQHHVEGLLSLACVIAAQLEEKDIFSGEQAFDDCDISHRIAFLFSHKSHHISQKVQLQAKQLHKLVSGQQKSQPSAQNIKQQLIFNNQLPLQHCGTLLALAYPERIAKKRHTDGQHLTAQGKGVMINPQDALADQAFIVAANVSNAKQNHLLVRIAAAVDIEQLQQWQLVSTKQHLQLGLDNQHERIIASEQTRIGAIVLNEKNISKAIPAEFVAQLWQQYLEKNGLSCLGFSEKVQALLKRWRWVNLHIEAVAFPEVSEQALLARLDEWFVPFVGEILQKKQLIKLDYYSMLLSLLNYQQQKLLSQLAPEIFVGPTGRKCPISYDQQLSPKLSLPMQEVYGMQSSPVVGVTPEVARAIAELDLQAEQKQQAEQEEESNQAKTVAPIALTLELLSPAQRPIQITQNLAAFWQGSYQQVQKDMKANYPKHYWPDDPANAKPTNKTKRHLQ